MSKAPTPIQDAKVKLGALSADRVRALSDSVFAFAMTALVLDLHLPEALRQRTNGEFLSVLSSHWHHLLSFVLSFVVLAMYWLAHHNTFLLVLRTTRALIVANFAFLLCIVLIPFAASFLGQDGSVQAAIVAYGAVLTLTSLVLAALVAYIFKSRELISHEHLPADLPKVAMRRVLFPVVVYLLSIGMSFLSLRLSILMYVGLPISFLLPSEVDHWAR